MRLREELDRLAADVQPFTEVDRVLRLARRRRAGRAALVSAVAVVAALTVVVAVPRWWGHRAPVADGTVRTRVTLIAPEGNWDRRELDRARRMLADRAAAAGLRGTTVTVQSGRILVLAVPGRVDEARLRRLVGPGTFSMRLVLGSVPDRPDAPAVPGPDPVGVTLDGVARKLGLAYTFAQTISDPTAVDETDVQRLAPFRDLTAAEVAVLPPQMRFAVPTVSCKQLDAMPYQPSTGQFTACGRDTTGRTKYLLDAPAVTGGDIASATPAPAPGPGGAEIVVGFKPTGQPKFTDLTRLAYDNGAAHQIGMVLDSDVVAAPAIQGVITREGLIPGLAPTDAGDVAALLRGGELPVPLVVSGVAVTP